MGELSKWYSNESLQVHNSVAAAVVLYNIKKIPRKTKKSRNFLRDCLSYFFVGFLFSKHFVSDRLRVVSDIFKHVTVLVLPVTHLVVILVR